MTENIDLNATTFYNIIIESKSFNVALRKAIPGTNEFLLGFESQQEDLRYMFHICPDGVDTVREFDTIEEMEIESENVINMTETEW